MCARYLKVQKVTYIFNKPKTHIMSLLLLILQSNSLMDWNNKPS